MNTISIKSQAGMGVIEALMAVALSAIVILGGVFGASKIYSAQQKTNVHYVVINELRSLMQGATDAEKSKWCSGDLEPEIKLPNEKDATKVAVTCEEFEVTLNNVDNSSLSKTMVMRHPVKFSLTSELLGGEVIVGELINEE